ncbi:hypothetical protein E2562_015065 [Oryza meyeriana var. granulata]|uniref:Uncharacterized protein n=1 Tax=Oryza meyeriana var. granulata TaxID=110450 RepID=A0A6G1EKR4_9ORYZ|nr:hypothetical protein E2562_015065 [Oryza meyeriana var. granulata]
MSYNFVIGLLLEGRHSIEQRYWKDIKQFYPGLCVAYIDEVEERDGDKVQKVFYSVLVKAIDNHDQMTGMTGPSGLPVEVASGFLLTKLGNPGGRRSRNIYSL